LSDKPKEAYVGYTFACMCLAVLGRTIASYSCCFFMPWTCLFLVRIM